MPSALEVRVAAGLIKVRGTVLHLDATGKSRLLYIFSSPANRIPRLLGPSFPQPPHSSYCHISGFDLLPLSYQVVRD